MIFLADSQTDCDVQPRKTLDCVSGGDIPHAHLWCSYPFFARACVAEAHDYDSTARRFDGPASVRFFGSGRSPCNPASKAYAGGINLCS